MVGVQGIGGVPEPKPDRPANVRDRNQTASSSDVKAQDGVVISSEAQAAAKLAHLIKAAESQPEVRTEKVEAAKASIARGDFEKPEVVAKVAQQISKLLDL